MPDSQTMPSSGARRLLRLADWITVEPVEFIYCVMFSVSNIVRDNLFIDKVCRLDMKYDEETCYNMTHDGREVNATAVDEVKKVTLDIQMIDGILVALPSVVFCLFLGAWSDANGRKLLLVLPFLGNALSFVAYMVCFAFFDQLPPYWLLLGSVVGLSGGYICLNVGLYGYIGDVTSLENRTTRMSILNGVFSLGYVVGTTLGGQLYKRFANYYLNFGVSLGLAALGIVWATMFVRESVDVNAVDPELRRRRFFELENVKESVRTTFKERPGSGRLRIVFLVLNFAAFMFPLNTTHYDYLLVKDRFNWDVADFSNYLTVQRICRFVGLFLLLPVLSRLLKMRDALIAAGGTVLAIIAYLLIAFSSDEWTGPDGTWDPSWIMYLSAAFQLNSVITVAIRSQCTKEVNQDEIGRIFSVVGFGQAVVPLFSNPLFGFISKATTETLPGAYLLVVDVLLLFVLGTSLFMYAEDRITASRSVDADEQRVLNA